VSPVLSIAASTRPSPAVSTWTFREPPSDADGGEFGPDRAARRKQRDPARSGAFGRSVHAELRGGGFEPFEPLSRHAAGAVEGRQLPEQLVFVDRTPVELPDRGSVGRVEGVGTLGESLDPVLDDGLAFGVGRGVAVASFERSDGVGAFEAGGVGFDGSGDVEADGPVLDPIDPVGRGREILGAVARVEDHHRPVRGVRLWVRRRAVRGGVGDDHPADRRQTEEEYGSQRSGTVHTPPLDPDE